MNSGGYGGNALPNLLGLPNGRFIAVGIEIAAEAPRLRSRYKPRTPVIRIANLM